jgi:hypothetical protein
MINQNEEWPSEQDSTAELPSGKPYLNPRRVMILYSIGLLMLVAWWISIAWDHPQRRASLLLQALLFLLLVVLNRVSKTRRDSVAARFAKPGMRRTLAALLPLFVLAFFGLSQLMEARQREADKQLALKREAWNQAVERQRNIADLAGRRARDSMEKYTEAFMSLGKVWEELKTADGQPLVRPHRDSMKKLNEAHDDALRAIELRRVEDERLRHLQSQRPNRGGVMQE